MPDSTLNTSGLVKPPALSFNTKVNKGYNYLYARRHPEKIVEMIKSMDLSRCVFKGQEHGIVQRQTTKKVAFFLSKTVNEPFDTGKKIPNQQPRSLWNGNGRGGTETWQNEDPFYGYDGGISGLHTLEAASTGNINVSTLTEEEFRTDMMARFKAHYAAQLQQLQAYRTIMAELRAIKTKEGLEEFDKKAETVYKGIFPERKINLLHIPDWTSEESHFQEEAKRRIGLLGGEFEYTIPELTAGLKAFNVGERLQVEEQENGGALDANRDFSSSNPSAVLLYKRGAIIDDARFLERLEQGINFLAISATHDNGKEWFSGSLGTVGQDMALLDLLLESAEGREDLKTRFEGLKAKLNTAAEIMLIKAK